MGLAEIVTLLLGITKVTGYMTLTWFQVFTPMLIVYAIVIVISIIYLWIIK